MEASFAGQTGEDGSRQVISCMNFTVTFVCSRSQSRMRGDYLFYEEKMETTQEEKDAKAALR